MERNVFLISFYIFVFVVFINFYAEVHQLNFLYAITNLITSGAGYLIGAILYLYISSLFEKKGLLNILLCLIPFALFFIFINIPFYLSSPSKGYMFSYLHYVEKYGNGVYLLELLIFSFYVFKSYQKYRLFSFSGHRGPSSKIKNNFNWVKKILACVSLFIIINIVLVIFMSTNNLYESMDLKVISLSAALSTFYISYSGLYHSKILIPNYLLELKNKKTNQASLSSKSILLYNEKLDHLLLHEKVFLNPSVTLSWIAKEMDISDKNLSKYINHNLQTSFYNLINQHRLDEFIHQIKDPKNKIYSLIALANQCGFKSKTSFYSYFKAKTGMTPSQFIKEVIPLEN